MALSATQIANFRKGHSLEAETLTKGSRGDYLLNTTIELDGDSAKSWLIVADVHQTQLEVQNRRAQLLNNPDLAADVVADVGLGSAPAAVPDRHGRR